MNQDKITKELDRIDRGFDCLDDSETWNAFISSPILDEAFDDETFLSFARDAAETARTVRYDLDYLSIMNSVMDGFTELLEKHKVPEEKRAEALIDAVSLFLEGRIHVFQRIAENENYKGEIPELPEDDIDTIDMACLFALLIPKKEVVEYLQEINVSYDYDQLHMVTWFSGQITLGKGKYSRTVPNHSARTTYNRLLNPYSLLWIAAALGEEPSAVKATAAEAENAKTLAQKCGIVRKHIPFSRIRELALPLMKECMPEEPEEENI